MKKYVKPDEWQIIEEGFHPQDNMIYESLMSLGNGYMGMRGNFEEDFSGNTLQGTYFAGIYYPDKTRVGWWKNGYPEYFAKVLNGTNFMGLHLWIDDLLVDLNQVEIIDFTRRLDMRDGNLYRSASFALPNGKLFEITSQKFVSLHEREIGVLKYSIKSLSQPASIKIVPFLDGHIRNQDANYDEYFWQAISSQADAYFNQLVMATKKTNYQVAASAYYQFDDASWPEIKNPNKTENTVSTSYRGTLLPDQSISLYKYIGVTTSRDMDEKEVSEASERWAWKAQEKGFDLLYLENTQAWSDHWKDSDITIQGDVFAQQGIRFNIFHLNQTYTGLDPRLNIGPKGFTGEKYGGSTYWDTEAYCLYFYLSTAPPEIARNLLIYRYNHLSKAKENAFKLGLKGALYPMVTMNGEECHNEWEITFEEIHRNGAIAYAIHNYIRYTGDFAYLKDYGLEVLLEISRFWASRVQYQPHKKVYMILGVTGPNEYENNVHNNWYTNRMAQWTLDYTYEQLKNFEKSDPHFYKDFCQQMALDAEEIEQFESISQQIYLPFYKDLGIFEQQDGYMDKEQILVKDLDPVHLPLNQNWSWDRILRSCFIKQADVLQGLFFLYDAYDLETKKRNFDFYEPRTLHESSLSPCVHAILASEIGYPHKAYEMYLRTARLDLDNYNNDTEDGLHITSMAGSWMSIVYGFGGLRILDNQLSLKPFLPNQWKSYSFKMLFRNRLIAVTVENERCTIQLISGDALTLIFNHRPMLLENELQLKI